MSGNPLKILLIGGAGLLSGAARHALLEAGHRVTVLSRGNRALEPHPSLEEIRADRHDASSLAAALKDARFDFTADFLAYNSGDIGNLMKIPGFVPGRLVMISSGQVYLVTRGKRPPFSEGDAAAPLLPAPPQGTRDRREWDYGMGKRAAEESLLREGSRRGIRTLALRLPVVQGEADGSRRLWAWLQRMKDGGPVLLPDGGEQAVRFVYAGDVALAIARLAEETGWPSAPAMNLAQPGECSLRQFLELAASCAGLDPDFLSIPADELRAAGLADTCAPYWGDWCSRPDPSMAFSSGFRARGYEDYLPSVVRAHMRDSSPEAHPGYSRRAEELALAEKLRGRGR